MNKKVLSIMLSTALLGQTCGLVSARPLAESEDDYSTINASSHSGKKKERRKKEQRVSTIRSFVLGTMLGTVIPTSLYFVLKGHNGHQPNVVLKRTPTACTTLGTVRFRAIEPHDNMDGFHSSILLFYYSFTYFELIRSFPIMQAKEILGARERELNPQTRSALEAMICFSKIMNAIYGSDHDPSAQSPQVVLLNPEYEQRFIKKLNAFYSNLPAVPEHFAPLKYGEKRNPCALELYQLIYHLANSSHNFPETYLQEWCTQADRITHEKPLNDDSISINEQANVSLRIVEESSNYYLQINLTDQQNNTSSWTIGNGPDAEHAITDMQYLVNRRSAEGNSSFGAPSAPPAEMFG